MAALLIQHGAALDVKDEEGQTPVALAMKAAKSDSGGRVLEILKAMARHDYDRKATSGDAPPREEL